MGDRTEGRVQMPLVHRHTGAKVRPRSGSVCESPMKLVYLKLAYKGDHSTNTRGHGPRSPLNRTFPAAYRQLLRCARKMNLDNSENRHLTKSTSHIVEQFTYSCSDTYIERTNRRSSQRMSELIPKRLMEIMT